MTTHPTTDLFNAYARASKTKDGDQVWEFLVALTPEQLTSLLAYLSGWFATELEEVAS
jgi:hypothetical protein